MQLQGSFTSHAPSGGNLVILNVVYSFQSTKHGTNQKGGFTLKPTYFQTQ